MGQTRKPSLRSRRLFGSWNRGAIAQASVGGRFRGTVAGMQRTVADLQGPDFRAMGPNGGLHTPPRAPEGSHPLMRSTAPSKSRITEVPKHRNIVNGTVPLRLRSGCARFSMRPPDLSRTSMSRNSGRSPPRERWVLFAGALSIERLIMRMLRTSAGGCGPT